MGTKSEFEKEVSIQQMCFCQWIRLLCVGLQLAAVYDWMCVQDTHTCGCEGKRGRGTARARELTFQTLNASLIQILRVSLCFFWHHWKVDSLSFLMVPSMTKIVPKWVKNWVWRRGEHSQHMFIPVWTPFVSGPSSQLTAVHAWCVGKTPTACVCECLQCKMWMCSWIEASFVAIYFCNKTDKKCFWNVPVFCVYFISFKFQRIACKSIVSLYLLQLISFHLFCFIFF